MRATPIYERRIPWRWRIAAFLVALAALALTGFAIYALYAAFRGLMRG